MIGMFDCQLRGWGGGQNPRLGRNLCRDLCSTCAPIVSNSAVMSTVTVHRRCEDETARERNGHTPSDADLRKIDNSTATIGPYFTISQVSVSRINVGLMHPLFMLTQ